MNSSGYQSTIRLVGIDAPEKSIKKNEPGQRFSQKATRYLTIFVLNNIVRIESHGQYFRVLWVVCDNATNVNFEIVKTGLAEVYRGRSAFDFVNDPYWEAEKVAKADLREMLMQRRENYISPRE